MATNQSLENLQKTTVFGLRSILKISNFKKSVFSSWTTLIALISAVLFLIASAVLQIDVYQLLIEIANSIISFLPNILGFTVAGYALVVGFIQTDLLERVTERDEESEYSLYQKMSGIFAINILLQGFSLMIAYLFHFIVYLNEHGKVKIYLSEMGCAIINWAGLIIISLCLTFSLLMVIQIVMNIFSFSQLHHYLINKSKINKEKNDNGSTNA